MKPLYILKLIVQGFETSIYLDDKDRAERLVNAMKQMLTKKGKKSLRFEGCETEMIDSDEDILTAFENAFSEKV